MPVFTKHVLSESADGKIRGVTATSAAGALLVHTVTATATGLLECLTLYGHHGATVQSTSQTPQFEVTNGATSGLSIIALPAQTLSQTPRLIFSQLPLSGTDTSVHTFSTATESYFVWGWIDRIATG